MYLSDVNKSIRGFRKIFCKSFDFIENFKLALILGLVQTYFRCSTPKEFLTVTLMEKINEDSNKFTKKFLRKFGGNKILCLKPRKFNSLSELNEDNCKDLILSFNSYFIKDDIKKISKNFAKNFDIIVKYIMKW